MKILIIRLSAIGDVAMTIPVIYAVAKAHPQHSFTLLTQTFLIPVFINKPSNVDLIGINTYGAEKTFWGLVRFASAFSKYDYDVVLDLHHVIRSRILCLFFRLKGKKIHVLDKARRERKKLTAQEHKEKKQIRPVVDRYADVFRAAGLEYDGSFRSLFEESAAPEAKIGELFGSKEGHWIGIAPFAKHKGKIYPPEEMEKIVDYFSRRENTTVFLFGGKGDEEQILSHWASCYPQVNSIAGRLSLNDELALMARLDVLLSMDSANMHFASLVETTVVSVWGATHPFTGFYGYRQRPENAVQLELDCRPCSVFGEKPCFRGDWACMAQLSIDKIIAKLEQELQTVRQELR